ncbi:hypothetical protein [Pyxidicoccus xibeiensis]|uniref:hypothetical protein n=1 Tax=Pyxidicoccus xibeiensis TaxID=2906759 RepID=UPI0020A7C019|nr:hypothetical protein [Pyxidicoccus xibeiensis]MCP3136903.1 hypothetical protein [Pyxidicoccus xibeiensis]
MRRLVEALDDWSAVRLGALGPVGAEAARVLNRKRAAFLVTATEKYGVGLAEVFALFILHSAFDDDLRQVLVLLSRDKQLGQTLGGMGTVREELERRGLKLSEYPERDERAGDVLRGLGRVGRDALATSEAVQGLQGAGLYARREHLPPPYQEAFDEVQAARIFAPGNLAEGVFERMTFGVPLGFYHLVAGTARGAHSLAEGSYEQATRELAPAALMVGLYAGGRGARSVRETTGPGGVQRLQAVVERLSERLGGNAIRELARYVQAQREAGLLVAEGGEAAAAALHEARGSVPKAQAVLSEAKSSRAGATSTRGGVAKSGEGVAALVREAAGFTREAVEAKLLQAELEAAGPRLPADVGLLKQQRAELDAPPPGVREGSALWSEYVTYRERRLGELVEGRPSKGPLKWEGYQQMRGLFTRGLEFERTMVSRLREDAALPRGERRWLKDFDTPRIELHVGVAKPGVPGVRYADVLVIEGRPPSAQPPRVETFSFKSRDLSLLKEEALTAQLVADASDALRFYGEGLNIRRPALKLLGVEVQVERIRLVYEGGTLRPRNAKLEERAVREARDEVSGVEVLFQ